MFLYVVADMISLKSHRQQILCGAEHTFAGLHMVSSEMP